MKNEGKESSEGAVPQILREPGLTHTVDPLPSFTFIALSLRTRLFHFNKANPS